MTESSQVYTLRDLAAWSRPGISLAVLGQPIGHSISPAMHNAALAALARSDARFSDWRYFRFEVAPSDLLEALRLLHEKKFLGVNLTVPHKVLAFAAMAEVDRDARPIGAVNTLRWVSRGWHGFNTDGYGLTHAVRETLGRDIHGSDIVLLGAGGAGRSAAVECLEQGCASLWIVNRSRENLDALLALLAPLPNGSRAKPWAPVESPHLPPAGTIIINATSSGLKPADIVPLTLHTILRPSAVFDMIYNPPRTALLRAAAELGIPHANGLSMLVHQGAKALEIWTGVAAAQTAPVMAGAARDALGAS